MRDRAERWIYPRSFLVMFATIGVAAFIQVTVVFGDFHLHYIIVPAALIALTTLLLGRTFVLQRRLKQESRRFRAVADFALEFTYFRKLDGTYLYASPACQAITGYGDGAFYAEPALMDRLIHPEDRALWSRHLEEIHAGGEPTSLDLRLVHAEGQTVWINHLCAPVYDERGEQTGVRSTNIDISERKAADARIEHMAFFDLLTGVPNRRSLNRHLAELVEERSVGGERFALFFLDLARFAHLNDTFGHEHGDRVLKKLARRLDAFCAGCRLFRFGGDEFALVSTTITEPRAALDYAARLLERIEEPLGVDGREVYLSGGIGIALFPFDGQDATTLVRHADAAMYRTKEEHAASIQLSSPALLDKAADFVSTESRIRQGLARGEFLPHFQPQIDLCTRQIVGFEALARWQTADGVVGPDKFIPIAEETGLITELGLTILEQACALARVWCDRDPPLTMSINVSGKQLSQPDFLPEVIGILEASGCDPAYIELEITEQVFLADPTGATEMLWKLKELGVSLALDDFGTGYSSLSYLKRLPFDTVKIDRSFTREICQDARDVAILRAILALSSDLELGTVIEGVETQQQLDLLVDLGCTTAQGFFFYRPMPDEEIRAILL